MAFSKIHKPLFAEHGFVKFPNTNPPKDENNNAYCEVILQLHDLEKASPSHIIFLRDS